MSKDAVVPGQVETGPLWNHFWNATLPQQQHSQFDLMSGESEDGMTAGSIDYSSLMASPSAQQPRVTSVIPPQVVSTPMTNSTGTPSFAFKLWNTGSGQVFRLSLLENATFETLLVSVSEKTRLSISTTTLATDKRVRKTLREPVSGQDLCLGYFDEDGDAVLISTDEDLKEAIGMAHGCGWTRLEVFLGANLETMEVFRRDHKSRRLRFFGMNPTGSWTAATIGVLSLAAGMGLMMFVKHQQKVL